MKSLFNKNRKPETDSETPVMQLPEAQTSAKAIPRKEANPLISFATASEVVAAQKKTDKANAEANAPDDNLMVQSLERYLADIFSDARLFKETETDIQSTMLDNLRRRNGRYSDAKMAAIKSANSAATFIPMTGQKCRTIEAFVNDIYLNSKGKRTWSLKPTPIVTLQDDVKAQITESVMTKAKKPVQVQGDDGQTVEREMTPLEAYTEASSQRASILSKEYDRAKMAADKMSRKVDDQMIEGGWHKCFSEAISDLTTFQAMIIKGPIFRKRKIKTGWNNGSIQYGNELVVTFERVSPLDFYPSRFSKHPNDGTPMCEKVYLQRSSLVNNRDEDGYNKKNINYVVNGNQNGISGDRGYARERADIEKRETASSTQMQSKSIGSTIEGIEFYCSVQGKDLIEYGILKDRKDEDIDSLMDYEINAITVNGKIVFIEFSVDELNRRPYSVTGFTKEIGSFWYKAPPQILRDVQDIVNAASRALVNNMAWASGPQVIIADVNRLAPGEDLTSFHVGKIWQGTSGGSGPNSKLVDFFQPDSRSTELIKIIEEFSAMADQLVEMPGYSQNGDNVSGAGRTSSGLSMLINNSNRGMKRMILGIDRNIFNNIIDQVVDYNLNNDEDESIKGDMNFSSDGITALLMKEQLSEARLKFLQVTQNEFDMKVIGLDGRAKILSDAMESLESDYDDIKPTEEKIAKLLEREELSQQQALRENEMKIKEKEALIQREAEVKQAEVQVSMEKLQLEKRSQDLEFKNKERELDIRADKQAGDRFQKMLDSDADLTKREPEQKKPTDITTGARPGQSPVQNKEIKDPPRTIKQAAEQEDLEAQGGMQNA